MINPDSKAKIILNNKEIKITSLIFSVMFSFSTFSTEAASFSESNVDSSSLYNEELTSNFQTFEKENIHDKALNLARQAITNMQSGSDLSSELPNLEQAWKTDPTAINIGVSLALIHLDAKNFAKVISIAKKIQHQQPNIEKGYVIEGFAYAGLKDDKSAKATFKKALTKQTGAPDASTNLAKYAVQEGDIDNARTLLNGILIRTPNDFRTLLHLAELESKTGHIDLSIALLKKTITKFPKTIRPRTQLAKIHLTNGDGQKSISLLTKSIKTLPQTKTPELLYQLALTYEQLKLNTLALASIEKAIKLNPDQSVFQFLRAKLTAQSGDFDTANNLIQGLTISYPNNPALNELQGKIAIAQNIPKKAIVFFKQALINQEANTLNIQLAMAYIKLGDKELAYKTLQNWLTKHPSDFFTRKTLADLLLSNNLYSRAKNQYIKIILSQPKNVAALNNVAWLEDKGNNFKTALQYAERAYEQAPNNPAILDTLGITLAHNNQTKKAISILQKAMKILPNNLSIQLHLAQAFAKDPLFVNDAIKLLENMHSLDSFPEAPQAQSLLKDLKNNLPL